MIGTAAGKFNGSLKKRSYSIELPDTRHPTATTVNGKMVPFFYDDKAYTTRIAIADKSVDDSVTVVVTTPGGDVDYEALKVTAAQRRMQGVLGTAASIDVSASPASTTLSQIAKRALTAPDARTREAALAVVGIGVVDKSEAPYLYRGTKDLSFYAPLGLIDANSFQTISADSSLPKGTWPLLPGQNRLWSNSSTNGTSRVVAASFSLQSQNVVLPEVANNIAPFAKISVSSTEPGYSQAGLTDGVVDGYPNDKGAEWSSNQLVGASCTLTWDKPKTVDRICLYDRPNATDRIISGRLTFSDGTSIEVDALPKEGMGPADITFPAKTITYVTFEVTGMGQGSEHAGLSEMQVFTTKIP